MHQKQQMGAPATDDDARQSSVLDVHVGHRAAPAPRRPQPEVALPPRPTTLPPVQTVAEIMDADPVTVTPQDDVETVIRLLRDNDLQGVPVVNEGGRCVGIVTEADLVIPDEEGDLHLPHYLQLFGGVVFLEPLKRFEDKIKKAFASTVKDLMSEDPVTVEASASVRDAAGIIAEKHHNRLPVVEHGRLVGIVTRVDVLGALTRDG